jgi:PAS domain-containing protein
MDMDVFYETRPAMTVALGVVGHERGRIMSADQAFGDLLECAEGSLIDRPLADVFHPDSRSNACEGLARVVDRTCRSFNGVVCIVTTNGSVRWFSIHACLTSGADPEQLLVRVFALPVRFLEEDAAKAQRTSSTDRLAVALDLEPLGPHSLAV